MSDQKKVREVVFWDCDEDGGSLSMEDMDEAIESYIDDLDKGDIPETLTVYGWARMEINYKWVASQICDYVFEHPLEEYVDPNETFDVPDPIKQAAQVFVNTIKKEFIPWSCDIVEEKEIDVAKWVKENNYKV